MLDNVRIARMLSETADLMEIAQEDGFRIRSYRNAAASIESQPESVLEMLKDPSKKVTDIKGIGKGIAHVLTEIAERGSFERRDEILTRYPPTALELLKIQGLGPKSIALLWEHYRVSTIDQLEALCKEGKLRELPRMGQKLEEKVLRSIEIYRRGAGRFLVSYADEVAAALCDWLGEVAPPGKIHVAGSYRRGKETIGDLDLLVETTDAPAVLERFVHAPGVGEVLGKGTNKASAQVGGQNLQVDVRALPAESLGAALQYFTGSKEHNIALRTRAVSRKFTLNEYGLFREGETVAVASAKEEDIYHELGLAWIPPELRENTGEIERAEANTLPALVDLADIRGDLHMHTVESDGRATLEEMALAAKALGYEYVAITDHSKALAMANGLDEKRVLAFARLVQAINKEGHLGIHVLAGIECDILRDGRMDLDDEALAALDIVIGSVHSYMNQESPEMTARLLRAVENPYLRVMGHPTGRVLLHRDPFPFDFDTVAGACAKNHVAMEINSSPERLDLHASLIRAAKSRGVRFVVDTDAHLPRHLGNMKFGVKMARRGWLEKADVLNALPLHGLMKAMRRRPS
ncbi:MAG: DNA polymerase/3'-5' exonuclease PolX [Bryobacterales bacterium]|nr:DNA polymerase/3'-5' exonuclease PolX [Bryobacterales bacterium]